MRTAVLSDIHGNLPALEAVVADAVARGCSAFVNLGDILSGPLWPRETADYLMQHDWLTISGNHERQVLTHGPDRISKSDRFTKASLNDRHLEWLESLAGTAALSNDVFLCHGAPTNDVEYFLETVEPAGLRPASIDEVRSRAAGRTEKLIICGHTHVPRVVTFAGRSVANPGSVGLQAYDDDHPFFHKVENDSPAARYGVLEGLTFSFVEVAYDYESAAARADRNGFPHWAIALRTGRLSQA